MAAYEWYEQLKKPSWAPPAELFGPVWTFLYVIIAVSFGYVGYLYFTGELAFAVFLPFILNLAFNFAFTPIMFGLRKTMLAAADVSLTLATLVWALASVMPFAPWVAYVNIPYVLWGAYATCLQLAVTYLNR